MSPGLAFAAKAAKKQKPEKDKKKQPAKPASGPRSLARQEWPPSIMPDYIGVGEKGYAVLADTAGRLLVVDLKQDAPKVVSELDSIGKRVVAMSISMQRTYALAWYEKNGEGSWALTVISMLPASEPTILSRMPLSYFSEPSSLATAGDMIAVAGTGLNGENQVIIYGGARSKKGAEPGHYGTMSFDKPITQLELQDKTLVVVQGDNRETQMTLVNISNPRSPARGKPVRFKGNFEVVAKTKDFFMVAGQNLEKEYEIHALAFKPAPRVVRGLQLPGVTDILDGAAQKSQILLLVNHKGRQAVLPVAYTKTLQLVASNVVLLPTSGHGAASKARIVTTAREAYVASDWGGVQVLAAQGASWQYLYSHTIPRLPAAAVVVGAGRAALGGADLKLYNMEKPDQPTLVESIDVGSPVKSMVSLGNLIIVLTREGLTMRSFGRPGDVCGNLKITGNYLTLDSMEKVAYVLSSKGDKGTAVSKVRIDTDGLDAEKSLEIPATARRAAALDGKLLVSTLNDLLLFKVAENAEEVTRRTFTNLAIRDLLLTEEHAVITAVDQNSRGFLLVLDLEQAELPTRGNVELPHDGAALALADNHIVTVGRNAAGKNLATLINIKESLPNIVTTIPVVDGASAVSIKDNLAVVAGRGLEVLALT